ncbi:unnamed protein product [Caenorhabditis brenneri]
MQQPLLFLFFEFLLLFKRSRGIDVFCGELKIFNEQRFGQGAITVSSQTTTDLKQCLDVCCLIPNCDGVTFEGITSTDFDDANCLLVSCEPTCQFNGPSTQNSSGVLSVLIHRIRNETTESTPSSTISSYIPVISSLTPFWFLALVIGVAAICIGTNVTLSIVYCIHCRRRKRSQKAHISTVKGGPTLHAYNPQV